MLPMTMAPRGFMAEEALALPARWEDLAVERARVEEERRAQAEAQLDAEAVQAAIEEQRERAAAVRRRAAEIEAEAAADDFADLTPRQRKERRVTRMILAAGGNGDNVEVIELKEIEAKLGASRTSAGELRQAAKELLKNGYNPMTAYAPQTWS